MDAMKDALKQKRFGKMGPADQAPQEEMAPEQEGGEGMAQLVAQLTPEQKQELLQLLSTEAEGSDGVQEGAPTSDEQAAIEAKMAEEPSEETDEALAGDARSMPEKPRNMGERAMLYAKSRMSKRGQA